MFIKKLYFIFCFFLLIFSYKGANEAASKPVASFLESVELTSENGQCCLAETFDMEGVLQAPVKVVTNERTASQYFKSDQKFFISNTFFQSAFSSQAVSSAYFLKKINGSASFPLYISHRQLLI